MWWLPSASNHVDQFLTRRWHIFWMYRVTLVPCYSGWDDGLWSLYGLKKAVIRDKNGASVRWSSMLLYINETVLAFVIIGSRWIRVSGRPALPVPNLVRNHGFWDNVVWHLCGLGTVMQKNWHNLCFKCPRWLILVLEMIFCDFFCSRDDDFDRHSNFVV